MDVNGGTVITSWIDNGWTIIEPINLEMEALVAATNELSVVGSKK